VFDLEGRVPDAAIDGPIIDAAIDAPLHYADVVLAAGPSAYWRFGPDSASAAVDATGGDHLGTYVGAMTFVPGAIAADGETAALFSGLNHVAVGDKLDFPGTASFTLEAWVKPTGATNSGGIITKNTEVGGNNRNGYLLFVSDDLVAAERTLTEVTNQRAFYGVGPPVGVWTHLVATYDGGTLTVFVDAAVRATSNVSIDLPDSTFSFAIGGRDGGPIERFSGAIDEVAIYPRALTPGEVTLHHDVGVR